MNLKDFTVNFADQFEDSDQAKIVTDTVFKDLDGWDSLTTMLVIAMIKTEYDYNVTASEINDCQTVEDLFNYIIK